jgi:hypothetical protein
LNLLTVRFVLGGFGLDFRKSTKSLMTGAGVSFPPQSMRAFLGQPMVGDVNGTHDTIRDYMPKMQRWIRRLRAATREAWLHLAEMQNLAAIGISK